MSKKPHYYSIILGVSFLGIAILAGGYVASRIGSQDEEKISTGLRDLSGQDSRWSGSAVRFDSKTAPAPGGLPSQVDEASRSSDKPSDPTFDGEEAAISQQPVLSSGTSPVSRNVRPMEQPRSVSGAGVPATNSPSSAQACSNDQSASAFQTEGPRSPAPILQQIDPNAPGNSFSVGSQLVSVEGVQTSPGTTALDVGISGSVNGTSSLSATRDSKTAPPSPASYSGLPSYRRSQLTGGFTYEEELFRSKWGWNAFNEAQKTALQSAQ